ncbi:hypothetical protein L7F22_026621 [Adiantum nelumboides]|nr:hypothetical protein [Adiantum nelumboides]
MASCCLVTCDISPVATRSYFPSLQQFKPAYWPWESITVGPLSVSPMGLGTWAWDSYKTGRLNGRSELLLGKFIRDYSGL